MKRYLKQLIALLGIVLMLGLPMNEVNAQCPMCRMSAESNLANGGTAGKGLNRGILYMLLTPYFIVGGIGLIWYRNRRREADLEEEDLDLTVN